MQFFIVVHVSEYTWLIMLRNYTPFILLLFQFTHILGTENFKSSEVGIVEFFRESSPLSFPVIDIDEAERLELRFDIFSNRKEILNYEIVLCDYSWEKVELNPYEYIDGYTENTFSAYTVSINTTYDYMHYRLSMPNRDIKFIKPGNFLIYVFRDGEREQPILIQRFVVFRKSAEMEVKLNKAASEYLQQFQELGVVVVPSVEYAADISYDMKLVVIQNNDWRSAKEYSQFKHQAGSRYTFDSPGQIVFPGRNEFRYFDIKSLKHISERIQRIEYKPPYYHVWLKPDVARGSKQYFSGEDLSGLFFIDNTDTDDKDITDADYVYVHFQLAVSSPFASEVYIDGALTGWNFDAGPLEYNPACKCYQKELLLKQGLYNYRYAFKDYNHYEVFYDLTEGEFYETGNSYLAIVYYKPAGEIYYQPAGAGIWPLLK